MPKLAEALIDSLRAVGVRRVFGIPGGPSIPYMEAMRNGGVDFLLVSNEQSAAIMADVTGRLTGVPGVCHATFGPGATNLATGVGCALLDRSPLLALTTEVADGDIGRCVQMNIDHQALFGPLTKYTARLRPGSFRRTLSAALNSTVSGVPGPAHLGLPADIAGAELPGGETLTAIDRPCMPPPDPECLELAKKAIMSARRPVLAIGLTALRLGSAQAVRAFADSGNIPVLLTPMAKGLVRSDHPCLAGVLFHSGSDRVANIYRQADLVIGLGYDPVEFNYESWMPEASLIHIGPSPADIPDGYADVLNVVGDLNESLNYLNGLKLPEYDWDMERVRENREAMYAALMPDGAALSTYEVLRVLREELPEDGILTGDVGAHLHLMGQLWRADEPNRFIITNGWSSMGFGVPAAIGAKLCAPDKAVACVTGDGGFLMNCGELMTARRLGLNVVIVVLCDRDLSLIEVKQRRAGVPQYGTRLHSGEYFGADRFFDVPVLRADDGRGVRDCLRRALGADGPVIVQALVDGSPYREQIARSYK